MAATAPTPVGLVLRGIAAAALGTAAMDTAQYAQYRAGGGTQSFLQWETSAGLAGWDDAPAPALVGKRLVERVQGRPLPPSRARLTNNVMHWIYGASAGAVLGLTAGSVRVPAAVLGPLFGTAVWSSGYVVLGAMGLYKPIWEYSPGVLARDLGNHLVYGTVSGAAFTALQHR